MSMSKAKYHVPQPGEVIEFSEKENSGMHYTKQVATWDSKHSTLTTIGGERYHIDNRASIKPAEPAKNASNMKEEELGMTAGFPPHVACLPTSFANEVARAKAIADAEAENKKRHEEAQAKQKDLGDKILALIKEERAVASEDENAQHDFENRLEYLRSLRIRQGK